MLYLIGLGLNEKGYSREAYDVISKAEKIYIENYTINFPYKIESLEKEFGKKFAKLGREEVESMDFLDEAKKKDVALLVYGSPLFATTHISLVEETKRKKIKIKILHNASVFDAVSETGLQLYKFGKIASIPKHEASSFMKIINENRKIGAHTLILVDIGMELKDALNKIKEIDEKIVLCSRLGIKDSKIFYGNIKKLENKKIKEPFCFVIPGKMHFLEEEMLEGFK